MNTQAFQKHVAAERNAAEKLTICQKKTDDLAFLCGFSEAVHVCPTAEKHRQALIHFLHLAQSPKLRFTLIDDDFFAERQADGLSFVAHGDAIKSITRRFGWMQRFRIFISGDCASFMSSLDVYTRPLPADLPICVDFCAQEERVKLTVVTLAEDLGRMKTPIVFTDALSTLYKEEIHLHEEVNRLRLATPDKINSRSVFAAATSPRNNNKRKRSGQRGV